MRKHLFSIAIILAISWILLASGNLRAEEMIPEEMLPSISAETPPETEIKLESPQSPVRDAILEFLKPEEWFGKLQQYIKVPLPGTEVKEIEVDRGKVSELNIEIGKETGVDLMKFFQFIGKVLVVVLEGIARLIRGFLPGV